MERFFEPAEVARVLQGFNPWWLGQHFAAPQFRRLAYTICRLHLDNEELKRAVFISGPRRVGKTTVLQQVAEVLLSEGREPKSVFYASLDHPLLKLLSLEEILRIYHENAHPERRRAMLLLDEVQYANDWDLQLKQLIDHRPEYRILATGSASVIQRQRLAESGVGRWVDVPMPPLSFYEFLQIRGEELPNIPEDLRPTDLLSGSDEKLAELAARFRPVIPLFRRYLLVGGFPETARQQDIALCQRLLREDVVERVLKRDMTALFHVRNVNDLERLFIYICLHSGGMFSVQTCATALKASAVTVSNFLQLLEQANLIHRLPPTAGGGKAVLKARYKIYLVDAALRNAVLLRGEEIANDPEEMGTVVETTVLRHLKAYYYRDTPAISYWRDAAGKQEVDIVVRSPKYTIPVEVKYRGDARLGAKDGLVAYSAQERAAAAYWVTQSDEQFRVRTFPGVDTKFLEIPAHIFCYLLGQAERLLWTGGQGPEGSA